MLRPPLLAAALIALASAPAAKPRLAPSIGESARYLCADGRAIEVLYSGGEVAVITIGDSPLELARVAGDGSEAYQATGLRWHVSAARAGDLTRDGQPATRCHAG